MRLYLVRHGKAERHSEDGRDDSRALTKRGRHQAAWLAERFAGGDAPRRILTSPAARAAETARDIARALGIEPELEDDIGLGAGPSNIIDVITTLSAREPVALVGHNPTMSAAAEMLVHGPTIPRELELRTGEAAVIELADPADPLGGGVLVELLRMPRD